MCRVWSLYGGRDLPFLFFKEGRCLFSSGKIECIEANPGWRKEGRYLKEPPYMQWMWEMHTGMSIRDKYRRACCIWKKHTL